MASFKERFKEKSSMVGKEGEYAMLSPVPSSVAGGGGVASGARPGRGAPQREVPLQPVANANTPQTASSGGFSISPSPSASQWVGGAAMQQPSSLFPSGVGQQHHVPPMRNVGEANQVVFGGQQRASSFGVGGVGAAAPDQRGSAGFVVMPLAFQPTGIMPSSNSKPQPAPTTSAPLGKGTDLGGRDVARGASTAGAVGSYNYSAAAAGPPRQEVDVARPQQDSPKKIMFGRRAGSTDPSPTTSTGPASTGRRALRNRGGGGQSTKPDDGCCDERPRTDPSVASQPPVQYKPYGVADYRRMKQELEKRTSGGLGPSDTDEQRAAALRTQKQKEYAENIKRINAAILRTAAGPTDGSAHTSSDELRDDVSPRATRPIPVQPPPAEVVEKLQRRERAFQYAKNVPKPKLRIPEAKSDDPSRLTQAGAESSDHQYTDAQQQTRLEKERQLADLEARHAQDRQMVENLKKQLRI